MVASLVRLLHSGPQDVRLLPTEGPSNVKAYVRVLIRAGRFTTQWQRLDFQQRPEFGTTAFCELVNRGELITRLYLVAAMPDIKVYQAAAEAIAGANFVGPRFGWTNSLGHALVAEAVLDIGGARVERLDSRLLEMHDEYDTPLEKLVNRNTMIGRLQNGFTQTSLGNGVLPQQVYVPLPFWFSRGDLGAALPIDAIHVDQVRVGITFRPVNGLYYTDSRAAAASVIPTVEGSALWPMLGSKFYANDAGGSIVPGLSPTPPSGYASIIPGVTMPLSLPLGETYLLAEYVYLDKPEANRFRLADIELPITQHYRIEPRDTKGFQSVSIPIEINNPVRHLYFMAQNYDALPYNAYFLATKDLNTRTPAGVYNTPIPWWPDASGLNAATAGILVPAFSKRGSEPLTSIEVLYEGRFVRTSTENCALYRSILPSLEERKSPWINRYMYCIPFGTQAGYFAPSVVTGEANFNKIMKKELRLGIARTGVNPQRCWIYAWAETYNVLKIFGGRASLMFAY